MASPLSVAEVVALAGLAEGQVRKDVEHGLFGSASPPRFAFPELVYFRTVVRLELSLGVEDRRRLYQAIVEAMRGLAAPKVIELGIAEIKIGGVIAELDELLKGFESWKAARVCSSPGILGGEHTFAGTRLSVRHVGSMLLRGASSAEVLEDYPSLSEQDLEFAKLFTVAYPLRGRPRGKAPH